MSERKSILVVGCGAMGGLFAALLNPVARIVGYDTNTAHVDAIRAAGLRVGGIVDRIERFDAVDRAEALAGQSFDAVLIFTKSSATGAVIEALAPVLGTRPTLVTLQNGMGNAEHLLAVPAAAVVRGVTMEAGRYVGPGHIDRLIGGQKSWLGPIRGTVGEIRWLGALLTDAGLPTEIIADPMSAVWAKFVFNSVMNPIGALLLGVNAARYEVPEIRGLIDDMFAESGQVVTALGGSFAYDPMEFVKKVRAGAVPLSKHAGSMASDIARGARTEIDELTGFIVREGERLGVPVPACKTVYRLVKGLELAARIAHGGA